MLEHTEGDFQIVFPKKKRLTPISIQELIKPEPAENPTRNPPIHDDEGIGSSSPHYESDEVSLGSGKKAKQKTSKKRKKKNGKKSNKPNPLQQNTSNTPEKHKPSTPETNNNNCNSNEPKSDVLSIQVSEPEHRRRRKSSRCDNNGNEMSSRSISWAEGLVLEPSRVRTSSEGSILKGGDDWAVNHYECDCGLSECDCDETTGSNHPNWNVRSIQWNTRFRGLSSMKKKDLNFVEGKFFYCDNQRHLKLGTGTTVYLGLTTAGKEVAVRKLKTKQLPQLKPSMVRKLLEIRHPNLAKYDEFVILKNQTYVIQELIDFSLGRWLEDKSICQQLDKLALCHQLVGGIQYLHNEGIAHKDLRPVNILLNQSGRLVVTNFGLVPHIQTKGKSNEKRMDELRSSCAECWRSAETIWEINENYRVESDIPPLGMLIYTILTDGQHPYGLSGRRDSVKIAIKNMLTPRYCLNLLNGNVFAKELVRRMLHKDPDARITAAAAFHDSLFWTRRQKLAHVDFILTGPKSSALEPNCRGFIPTCGHFGELPSILAATHDADSSTEALEKLSEAYDGSETFLEAILDYLPQLVPLTQSINHDDEEPSEIDEADNDLEP